jgi:hypothetical protein
MYCPSKSDHCVGLGARKRIHATSTAASTSSEESGRKMGKVEQLLVIPYAILYLPLRQEQISESHTMERFLCASLGLLGSTPVESALLDMYHTTWTDMMGMFMWKVWRAPSEESKRQGAKDFWAEFPKFLEKHDLILKSAPGPFYFGSSVSPCMILVSS